MQSALINLTYEIELKDGEPFLFPEDAIKRLSPGKWWISIRPANNQSNPIRGHGAFLNSYAAEDEGLY